MASQSGFERALPPTEPSISRESGEILNALSRARDASAAEWLRIVAAHTGHAAINWNIASDQLWWSEAAAAVLGVEAEALPQTGNEFHQLMAADDLDRRRTMLLEPTQVDDGDGIEYDVTYRISPEEFGGQPVLIEERGRLICEADGSVRDVIAIIRRAGKAADAAHQADLLDPDTALATRPALVLALEQILDVQDKPACGLVLAAISNIQDISDTYGAAIVPDVIRATSVRLRSVMRGADMLCRTGPVQFGMLLRDCSSEQLLTAGDRFVAAIRNEVIDTPQGPVWVELTAGALTLPAAANDAGTAMVMAEEALEQASNRVGPAFVAYRSSPDRALQHQRNRQSAVDIVAALNEERFTLWHQPIVSAGQHQPVMYESLLRMKSETGDIVPAAHLVPIAEKLGFMQMIDAIVCRTSLDLMAARPDMMVSFNLSDATLRNSYAVERLLSFVAEAGDVAQRLCIEISHASLARQTAGMVHVNAVERLRGLGCKIAMSGYLTEGMSIAVLKAVDIVKLDGSVCAGISERASDLGLLKSAVNFAHRAGVKVVAEHVETERDAAVLAEAGVDYLQGYLFGRASPEHFNLTLSPLDAGAETGHAAEPAMPAGVQAEISGAEPAMPAMLPPVQSALAPDRAESAAEPDAIGLPDVPANCEPVAAGMPVLAQADLLREALNKLDSI